MIKILHTGDIHLGDLAGPTKDGANLRRQDTLRCMDAIVNKARTEGPTVTIIAGDLFNRSRVWADTALDDVNDAISRFIVPLCEYSDAVVLLFGTMNHDTPVFIHTKGDGGEDYVLEAVWSKEEADTHPDKRLSLLDRLKNIFTGGHEV